MSIIDDMRNDQVWDDFLEKKRKRVRDYTDIMQVQSFINSRGYRPIVEAMAEGTYKFRDPYLMEVPKDNGKVRRVFTIRRKDDVSEIVVLQVMAQLLKRYEVGFCPNLYSLPENGNVVGVMNGLAKIKDLDQKYLFKFDVTDYGNSILVDKLLVMLDELMEECDRPIFKVISDLLMNPNVILRKGDQEIPRVMEQKGVMTGFPFVHFLSGLYLNEMDWHFYNLGIPYYRFNDDVAVVCNSLKEAEDTRDYILDHITSKGLSTNRDKMQIIKPGDISAYLGIAIDGSELYITNKTITRYKKKMYTRAKLIRNRINSKEISRDEGFVMMIRYIQNVMYGSKDGSNCFMTTYFPRVTSSKNFSKIDHYAQHYVRFVYVGRFLKTNNRKVPYEMLREYGYIPLVSAYRMYREH